MTFVSTTIIGLPAAVRLGGSEARLGERRHAQLAAEGINPGEQRLRIRRRGGDDLLESDEDLAVQTAPMLSCALLEPQVEGIGHALDRQRRHGRISEGVHSGTIMEPNDSPVDIKSVDINARALRRANHIIARRTAPAPQVPGLAHRPAC